MENLVRPKVTPKTSAALIPERRLAGRTLMASAQSISDSLTTFSSWLMIGVGSAFSLVVTNIEKISQVIEITKVRFSLLLLLGSLVLAVLVKLLLAMVGAIVSGNAAGTAISKELVLENRPIDIELFFGEPLRGIWWPFSWLTRNNLNKTRAGDIAAGARLAAKTAQLALFILLAQCLLIVVAAGALVLGMKT